LKKPATWIDLFILATLLFPAWLSNFGFLRLMRLWTLLHSDFFWRTVGHKYDDTRVEEITRALASLVTFVFVVTGFVYASFLDSHPGIKGYLDALYFTVATLTTTGFGDITLPGAWGRVLSIVVMLTGITLFLRLAQTIISRTRCASPAPHARCRNTTRTPSTARPAGRCSASPTRDHDKAVRFRRAPCRGAGAV